MSARDDLLGRPPKMRRLTVRERDAAAPLARDVQGDRTIVHVPRRAIVSGEFTRSPVTLPTAPWEGSP